MREVRRRSGAVGPGNPVRPCGRRPYEPLPAAPRVDVTVRPARSGPDHAACKDLILQYAREFADHLGRQDFWDEVHWLAEHYGPPDGALLVAEGPEGTDGAAATRIVGLVAYERVDETTCRMRRMMVLPSVRGEGIGARLCEALLRTARQAGYERMVLDTVDDMVSARALYERHGFARVKEPDWDSPCVAPVFMQRAL